MSKRKRLPIKHDVPLTFVEACRKHCWKRAWQRFGLALSIGDIMDLERQITSGRAEFIMDQHRGLRTVYWVRLPREPGTRMIGVFDVSAWVMVTILPGLGYLRGVPE